MPGTLIPPWFDYDLGSRDDIETSAIFFGISIGLIIFATIRAGVQTYLTWKRAHRVTAYIFFVWTELLSSSIIAGIIWGYDRGGIPPSLWFFTGIIFLWILQVQSLPQIIITRIALIENNKTRVNRLRWGVFAALVIINIAVACIWIPARLQLNETFIAVNEVWDRTEKALIAVIDLGLNLYFIYVVRTSLIAYGLTRYNTLYHFNLLMICISITMDVLMIVTMSIGSSLLYVSFHPLAYLVKLHIEISMSQLIVKIVKAAGHDNIC